MAAHESHFVVNIQTFLMKLNKICEKFVVETKLKRHGFVSSTFEEHMCENGVNGTQQLYLHQVCFSAVSKQYNNKDNWPKATFPHETKSRLEKIHLYTFLLILICTYLSFLQITDFVFNNCHNLSYWRIIHCLRRGWFFRLRIRS